MSARRAGAPIRVLLADDHQILVDGLRRLIDATPDLRVVATANDAVTTLAAVGEHRPDVLVIDISMPGGGLEVLRALKASQSGVRVVVLTMYSEERYVLETVRLGASAYVQKRSADRELLDAIRAVADGRGYLTPTAARLLLGGENSDRPEPVLSAREREVLSWTARGYSNQEIGDRLLVSAKTVDTYRSRVMTKLQLHRRAELVSYALEHGLME